MFFATRMVSSLEKVFCTPDLPGERLDRISGAQGETVAFQLACKAEENLILEFECSSPFGEALSLREVGLVPSTLPAMPEDPFVLTSRPGLFPDPLLPMEKGRMRVSRGNWHAIWCSVRIPADMEPGESVVGSYEVTVDSSATEKEYGLNTEIRYYDANDNSILSKSMKAVVDIKDQSGPLAFFTSPIFIIIVVAIVLIGGYYVFMKRKGKV